MTLPRILIALCFVVLLGVPLLFQPRSDAPDAAQGDALELIIITPHNEQIRYEFARAFDRWHRREHGRGVKVIYNVPGGTSEIRKMLESQYAAAIAAGREPGGDADLVFGGGSFEHGRFKRGVRVGDRDEPISQPVDFSDDLLREIYGENSIGGDPIYDADRHWFGLALSGFGIVFNRDALESLGIPEPDSWSEMGDPRLRGWVALVNPGQSGSVTTAFESILKREGWIRGWQILRRMAANARYFSGSSLKPPMDVSMGDAAAGVCIDFYGRFQSQALREAGEGDRIGYVDPPGGSTIDADPISMLRGAPHPETAKRFIEFCLSDEGQALWQFEARGLSALGSRPSDGTISESRRPMADSPFGPEKFELRRLPVKRSMFEQHSDHMIDQVNPYDIATPVTYPDPNFRDFIAPMYAAMAIDNHHELREAWEAIVTHPAYAAYSFGLVTAEDVREPDLKAMLMAFDALPDVPGPDGRSFNLGDVQSLGEIRSGWLRNGWAKDGLWDEHATPIDALRKRMGRFFRERYGAVVELSWGGSP